MNEQSEATEDILELIFKLSPLYELRGFHRDKLCDDMRRDIIAILERWDLRPYFGREH